MLRSPSRSGIDGLRQASTVASDQPSFGDCSPGSAPAPCRSSGARYVGQLWGRTRARRRSQNLAGLARACTAAYARHAVRAARRRPARRARARVRGRGGRGHGVIPAAASAATRAQAAARRSPNVDRPGFECSPADQSGVFELKHPAVAALEVGVDRERRPPGLDGHVGNRAESDRGGPREPGVASSWSCQLDRASQAEQRRPVRSTRGPWLSLPLRVRSPC